MPRLTLIGDVHGLLDRYAAIVRGLDGPSIQVGDLGFGKEHTWHGKHIDPELHKVCFGNHDDPAFLDHPHSTGDFRHFPAWDLLTIRGAFSIDRAMRIEGRDWWPDEELSYARFQECVDLIARTHPAVIVSHDAPASVVKQFFGYEGRSITNAGLQACFEVHQPKLWVFGHHHAHRDVVVNGTRFVCLDELETFVLGSS